MSNNFPFTARPRVSINTSVFNQQALAEASLWLQSSFEIYVASHARAALTHGIAGLRGRWQTGVIRLEFFTRLVNEHSDAGNVVALIGARAFRELFDLIPSQDVSEQMSDLLIQTGHEDIPLEVYQNEKKRQLIKDTLRWNYPALRRHHPALQKLKPDQIYVIPKTMAGLCWSDWCLGRINF